MKNAPVKNMQYWISVILRTGVFASATLILGGGILFLIQHPTEISYFKVFKGQPEELRHIGNILTGTFNLSSRSIIQSGILIMIATPFIRVLFSFFVFIINRDLVFVVVTAIVLSTLFYSLLG